MATLNPSEYEARIAALEKLNVTLAAEIDRQRPVVKAAVKWRHRDQCKLFLDAVRLCDMLNDAIDTYESSGGKDGGGR